MTVHFAHLSLPLPTPLAHTRPSSDAHRRILEHSRALFHLPTQYYKHHSAINPSSAVAEARAAAAAARAEAEALKREKVVVRPVNASALWAGRRLQEECTTVLDCLLDLFYDFVAQLTSLIEWFVSFVVLFIVLFFLVIILLPIINFIILNSESRLSN